MADLSSGVACSAELHADLCDALFAITLSRGDVLALIQMLLKGIGVIGADERPQRLVDAGGGSGIT